MDNSDFRPEKIDRILHEYRVSDIQVAHIEGTEEYFIYCEGNHRISLWKLSGMESKSLPLITVTPKTDPETLDQVVVITDRDTSCRQGLFESTLEKVRKLLFR